MVVLAGTCGREALMNNFMIAEKVSALGFLLLSALYISSISSCLATLYGTPRVLQSIAAENTMPAIARLSDGVRINFNFVLCAIGGHKLFSDLLSSYIPEMYDEYRL